MGLLEGTVDPLSGLKSGPNYFRGLVQFGPLSERKLFGNLGQNKPKFVTVYSTYNVMDLSRKLNGK